MPFWNHSPYTPQILSLKLHSTGWSTFVAERLWPGFLQSYLHRLQPLLEAGPSGAYWVNLKDQEWCNRKRTKCEIWSLESEDSFKGHYSKAQRPDNGWGFTRKKHRRTSWVVKCPISFLGDGHTGIHICQNSSNNTEGLCVLWNVIFTALSFKPWPSLLLCRQVPHPLSLGFLSMQWQGHLCWLSGWLWTLSGTMWVKSAL